MTPKKKPAVKPKGYLTTSEIHFRTGVARQTISSRLRAEGVEPHPSSTTNEKYYPWNERIEAIVRGKGKDNAYDDARIDKTAAEAELKQLQVMERKGELLKRSEVVNEATILFNILHKKLAVQIINELVDQIRKVSTVAEARAIAKQFNNQPFMDALESYAHFIDIGLICKDCRKMLEL